MVGEGGEDGADALEDERLGGGAAEEVAEGVDKAGGEAGLEAGEASEDLDELDEDPVIAGVGEDAVELGGEGEVG